MYFTKKFFRKNRKERNEHNVSDGETHARWGAPMAAVGATTAIVGTTTMPVLKRSYPYPARVARNLKGGMVLFKIN